MRLAAEALEKSYDAIVIDPAMRVVLARVCADIELYAQILWAFEGLQREVFADICAEILGPGFAPSRIELAAAFQRSTSRQSGSHLVNRIRMGRLMIAFVVCIFIGICLSRLYHLVRNLPKRGRIFSIINSS